MAEEPRPNGAPDPVEAEEIDVLLLPEPDKWENPEIDPDDRHVEGVDADDPDVQAALVAQAEGRQP